MNSPTDTQLAADPQPGTEGAIQRVLVLEMVRVTEQSAIAAAQLVGRGDEKAAEIGRAHV